MKPVNSELRQHVNDSGNPSTYNSEAQLVEQPNENNFLDGFDNVETTTVGFTTNPLIQQLQFSEACDPNEDCEELWKKWSSLAPRKWKSFGSEIEVDLETKRTKYPLITIHAYRYIESFDQPYEFKDTIIEANDTCVIGFPSVPKEEMPLLELAEKDVGIQVIPQKATIETQTGFHFKRNKITQYETQHLDPERVKQILAKAGEPIVKKTKGLQRALLQNEMMNLAKNDYELLKAIKGNDIEYEDMIGGDDEDGRYDVEGQKNADMLLLEMKIDCDWSSPCVAGPVVLGQKEDPATLPVETEEEVEKRLKEEYKEYLKFEAKLISQLKFEEPKLSSEKLDVDFQLDQILESAKENERRIRMQHALAEMEDEETEEIDPSIFDDLSPALSSLGSDFDFLKPSPPIQEETEQELDE